MVGGRQGGNHWIASFPAQVPTDGAFRGDTLAGAKLLLIGETNNVHSIWHDSSAAMAQFYWCVQQSCPAQHLFQAEAHCPFRAGTPAAGAMQQHSSATSHRAQWPSWAWCA